MVALIWSNSHFLNKTIKNEGCKRQRPIFLEVLTISSHCASVEMQNSNFLKIGTIPALTVKIYHMKDVCYVGKLEVWIPYGSSGTFSMDTRTDILRSLAEIFFNVILAVRKA